MRLSKALKKLEAHVWEREANEHYVEPDWCSRRLFEEEDFRPAIWDPCAGFGRIPEEAAKQGLKAHATDIVDRGYSAFDGVQNFLTAEATRASVIVCNSLWRRLTLTQRSSNSANRTWVWKSRPAGLRWSMKFPCRRRRRGSPATLNQRVSGSSPGAPTTQSSETRN